MKDGGNKKGGEVWNEKRRLVIVKNVREGVNVKRKEGWWGGDLEEEKRGRVVEREGCYGVVV